LLDDFFVVGASFDVKVVFMCHSLFLVVMLI
jgi:hypothetical protein